MDATEERIIQRIWDWFESTGEWPLVDDLVVEFDNDGIDFEMLTKSIRGVVFDGEGVAQRARLLADVLPSLPQARPLLEKLPKLLALAATRYLERGPAFTDETDQARVSQVDFGRIWGDARTAGLVFQLVTENAWWFPFSGFGGRPGEKWLQPTLDILRLTHITTLDDYLRDRASDRLKSVGDFPSGKHLDVLKRIYRNLLTKGDWPQALPFAFDNLDLGFVPDIVGGLDSFIPRVQFEFRLSTLRLNARAIPFIDIDGELRGNVFGALRGLAKLWRAERQEGLIPLTRIATLASVAPATLGLQLRMLDPGIFRGMATDKDHSIQGVLIDRSILRFKAVTTWEEFVGAREFDAGRWGEQMFVSSPSTGLEQPSVEFALELGFLKSERIQRIVEDDIREFNAAMSAGANRAALILLGAALEAILYDVLDRRKDRVQSLMKKGRWPQDAALKFMLDAARNFQLLDPAASGAAAAVKDYRDLVHPWRLLNANLHIDRETVEGVQHLLVSVVRSIRIATATGKMTEFENS